MESQPCPATIDLNEAVKDSPRFRQLLGQHEQYFGKLESKLNEVLKIATVMLESGRGYVGAFYNLSVAVNQLSLESFAHDPITVGTFKSLSDAFAEIVHLQKNLIEQSHTALQDNLNNFIKNELAKVSETRCHFEQLSNSMDEALARRSAINRHKTSEAADARNSLTAIGTCFAHTALDYSAQISIAHAHKNHAILEALWAFLKENCSFFGRGHAFFDEWKAIENGTIADTISTLTNKSRHVERKMQDRHTLVPKEVFQHPTGMSPDADVVMEGYLFKRATNAFKTWNRRWFQIRDNRLLYSHRSPELEAPTVMESDLKLCLVRAAPPAVDRACCFELVTPTKSHLLQADSETLCNAWMRALQRTIHHLHESDEQSFPATSLNYSNNTSHLTRSPSDSISESFVSAEKSPSSAALLNETTNANSPRETSSKRGLAATAATFEELRRIPGNELCADCAAPDPKWVSINIGVLLCIECCGIHRSLGVQISKVRSLTMDSIELDQRCLLLALGNARVNAAYLAHLPPPAEIVPPPAKPNSTRPVREAWIKAKYVERRFTAAPEERARITAQARCENLGRRTPGIGASLLQPNSPTRSSSLVNLSAFEASGCFRAESEPATQLSTVDNCTRLTNGVEITVPQPVVDEETSSGRLKPSADRPVWRSSPILNQRKTTGARLSEVPAYDFLRISSCGSDTNLRGSDDRLDSGAPGQLRTAIEKGDLAMLCSLQAKGTVDFAASLGETTTLHLAVEKGDAEIVEYLLLNGAKVNALDSQLNTPLHVAAQHGKTLQVCKLMKRGADENLKNHLGQTALEIAVDGKYADIVTLLRLQTMRGEFSEEFNNPMDETVDNVIEDITRRAALGKNHTGR